LAKPLVPEPASDSEPVRDLKSEDLSAKFEAEDREPPRDLNSELLSAKPEARDNEPVKALARPLI